MIGAALRSSGIASLQEALKKLVEKRPDVALKCDVEAIEVNETWNVAAERDAGVRRGRRRTAPSIYVAVISQCGSGSTADGCSTRDCLFHKAAKAVATVREGSRPAAFGGLFQSWFWFSFVSKKPWSMRLAP